MEAFAEHDFRFRGSLECLVQRSAHQYLGQIDSRLLPLGLLTPNPTFCFKMSGTKKAPSVKGRGVKLRKTTCYGIRFSGSPAEVIWFPITAGFRHGLLSDAFCPCDSEVIFHNLLLIPVLHPHRLAATLRDCLLSSS